jgi:hypothetical protein
MAPCLPTRWRLRALVAVAALALPAAARASTAGPIRLALADVLDEPVRIGPPDQPRAAILYFMSRASGDASAAFARAVDERLLDAPVDAIAVVDVRRYGGGLLRGIALSRMRASEREVRDSRRERRLARGVDAQPASRWHLVADFDGAVFARFGVASEPARPIAFLVDRAGNLAGPYDDADALCAAFAASTSRPDATRASVLR